jgi:IS5 family transposase
MGRPVRIGRAVLPHPLPELLHGAEQELYGDVAYASQQALMKARTPHAQDRTNQRIRPSSATAELDRVLNRARSRVHSRVEHVLAVVKKLWGFGQVRYRALAKNATRAFVALDLANIGLARQHLMAQMRVPRAS